MSETQPSAIDFTQEDKVSQILPRLPLRSSHTAGWHGIYVQQHHQPAWQTPEYCSTQHLILIHESEQLIQAERRLDGRRQHEQLSDGNVVIVPANAQHQVSWDQENSFILLFLEPTNLAHIAYEAVNVDRVDILPQFAMRDPLIYQIGRSLQAELQSNANGWGTRLYAEAAATMLAVHLLKQYSAFPTQIPDYAQGLSSQRRQLVLEYIHEHLSEDLSLAAIASSVGMSPYYFARLFKQSMGIAPYQYVLQQRVERAKQLLKTSRLSIAAIAHRVGFSDQSQLTVQFRKFTSTTPKAYRDGL